MVTINSIVTPSDNVLHVMVKKEMSMDVLRQHLAENIKEAQECNANNDTPVHTVCSHCNEEYALQALDVFWAAGAEISDMKLMTHALTSSNYLILERLLQFPTMILEQKNWNGDTIFHIAAKNTKMPHSIRIFSILELRNFNLELVNNEGETVLHKAVQHGNFEVVEWLLNFGVKLNVQNINGKTPLDVAIFHSDIQITTLLIDHLDRLHDSTTLKNEALYKFIFKTSDPKFFYAKHFAFFELLLKKGCDLNYIPSNNFTTIFQMLCSKLPLAHHCFSKEIIDIVYTKERVNIKDNKQFLQVYYAFSNCQYDQVRFLLSRGSEIQFPEFHEVKHYMIPEAYNRLMAIVDECVQQRNALN